MTGWLARAIEIRSATDPVALLRARLVLVAAAVMAVAVSIQSAARFAIGNVLLALCGVAIASLAVSAGVLARRGRLAAAEWAIAAGVAGGSLVSIVAQGPASSRIGVLHLAIIVLGVAARPWMAPAQAALSIGMLGTVMAAGVAIPLSPWTSPAWLAIVRQVVVATLLVLVYNRGYRRAYTALVRRTAELDTAHIELLAARDRLEQLVRERSVELERATAELEAFASTVSHDLRAPLRHVSSFLAMLAEDAGALDSAELTPIAAAQNQTLELTAKLEAILADSRRAQRRESPAASS
jgi:signal transduction histidine kinase